MLGAAAAEEEVVDAVYEDDVEANNSMGAATARAVNSSNQGAPSKALRMP